MSFICGRERIRYSGAASHLTEIDMTSRHARYTEINQARSLERVQKAEHSWVRVLQDA